MPDKAIDLVDEACANVRVQLDSVPEDIDALQRQRYRLQVEEKALSKEKDKARGAHILSPPENLWQCTLKPAATLCCLWAFSLPEHCRQRLGASAAVVLSGTGCTAA